MDNNQTIKKKRMEPVGKEKLKTSREKDQKHLKEKKNN